MYIHGENKTLTSAARRTQAVVYYVVVVRLGRSFTRHRQNVISYYYYIIYSILSIYRIRRVPKTCWYTADGRRRLHEGVGTYIVDTMYT